MKLGRTEEREHTLKTVWRRGIRDSRPGEPMKSGWKGKPEGKGYT